MAKIREYKNIQLTGISSSGSTKKHKNTYSHIHTLTNYRLFHKHTKFAICALLFSLFSYKRKFKGEKKKQKQTSHSKHSLID